MSLDSTDPKPGSAVTIQPTDQRLLFHDAMKAIVIFSALLCAALLQATDTPRPLAVGDAIPGVTLRTGESGRQGPAGAQEDSGRGEGNGPLIEGNLINDGGRK